MSTSQININGESRDVSGLSNIPSTRDFRSAWQFNGSVIEVDVEKAKPIARAMVNKHRDKKKHAPFTVDGLGEFSADEDSKSNVDGAAQAALMSKLASQPFSINWSLHDNTAITLDADQMQAVGLALMAHIDTAYTDARTKKDAIDSVTTMDEIEAVLATLT